MHSPRRTLLTALPLAATAQPAAPRIVVGFPPGGPLDIAARIIAPRLGSTVENQVGESGNLATRAVARAAPDGATLLLCGPVHAINMTLFPGFEVDILRDLAPVAGIARVPLILEVRPAISARSVAEFIALGRARRLRVAYAGIGTPQHIAIALFEPMAGVRFEMIAHPGSAQALEALLRGEADAMFDPAPSSMPHVAAGRLVALATTGPTRAEALPDLPCVAESLPGYEAGSWFGLAAPRGTPEAAIAGLHAAVEAGLRYPGVRQALARLGAAPMPGTVAAFGQFLASETTRYAEIIRRAGIPLAG